MYKKVKEKLLLQFYSLVSFFFVFFLNYNLNQYNF
jgi:hypothetical protein